MFLGGSAQLGVDPLHADPCVHRGKDQHVEDAEEASPHRVTTAIGVWISLPGRSRCSSWVQRRGQYIITQTPAWAMNAPATSARSDGHRRYPNPRGGTAR